MKTEVVINCVASGLWVWKYEIHSIHCSRLHRLLLSKSQDTQQLRNASVWSLLHSILDMFLRAVVSILAFFELFSALWCADWLIINGIQINCPKYSFNITMLTDKSRVFRHCLLEQRLNHQSGYSRDFILSKFFSSHCIGAEAHVFLFLCLLWMLIG